MKRYAVEVSPAELFEKDELSLGQRQPAAPRSLDMAVYIDDSAPCPEASPSSDDESVRPRKRARGYSMADLDAGERKVLVDLLELKGANKVDFAMDCSNIIEHMSTYHPLIAKKLKIRTLQRWRKKQIEPVPFGPEVKRGPPTVLSDHHRRELGALFTEMGEAGSPMNYTIAKPVFLGYFQENGLMHLYSAFPETGKICLSQSWINAFFLEFNLADRVKTSDAQSLPNVYFVHHLF
jgi:hypothetical protein